MPGSVQVNHKSVFCSLVYVCIVLNLDQFLWSVGTVSSCQHQVSYDNVGKVKPVVVTLVSQKGQGHG